MAVENLSFQIETAVHTDIEVMLYSKRDPDTPMSEEAVETVKARTRTYTNQILSNIQGNRQFFDYPLPGYITYFVYIDKAEYQEKVRKDIEAKRKMLLDMVRSADREFEKNAIARAVQGYANAFRQMTVFFGNIPIVIDINEDGKGEDLSVALRKSGKDPRFSGTE